MHKYGGNLTVQSHNLNRHDNFFKVSILNVFMFDYCGYTITNTNTKQVQQGV